VRGDTTETILVTSGNIGDSVVEGLTRKGKRVRAAVRKKQPNAVWDKAGVEQVEFDYAKPETLARAFEGVDAYFSLSPLIENLSETGIQSIEAAKGAGVRLVVRASVLGAAEDGITFPRWHRAVEKALEGSGMAYTILQPTSFMQNYLFSAGTIKKEGKFYAPLGNSKTSLVDARDIAEAAVAALTEPGHHGKKYKITGGEAISAAEIAQTISAAIGKPVQYVAVSLSDARASMLGSGMPLWMVDGMSELYDISAQGWLAGIEPDFEHLVGRKPRTFRQFAEDFRSQFV
jgi:uncharacterized protein YbjT (DUF2867 family)